MRVHEEHGGVIGKLLGVLLLLVLLASTTLYLYGRQQQPLAVGAVHVATSHNQTDHSTVVLTKDGQVYVATVVHNDGRLPVTLQGLADVAPSNGALLVPVAIALGDGKSAGPATAAAFTPIELDPGGGVGVVVTYGPNPELTCARYGAHPGAVTDLPPVPLRFTSYGVVGIQSVALGSDAPSVAGITRTQCERIAG